MRRLVVSLLTMVLLVTVGFALGRFVFPASSGNEGRSVAVERVTIPVLITATPDPNVTPQVIIVTATPLPGSIGVLPTGILDEAQGGATQPAAPTIDPEILSADSVLQATVSALPENCILHTLAEGEFPSLVAETYGANLFDLLEINGLDEDTSRFLDIGDVLIVPLEGCPLTPAQVVSVTGGEDEAEATAEVTAEATAEATDELTPVATITLPPTAVNARVEIVRVISAGDITAEGVEIRNTGGVVDLQGWTLADSEGNTFTFPEQRLFTNGLVTVFTRRGTNTPISLYWGRSQAVWGEPGDAITLTDDDGDVQATLRLSGS
jgi:hypothetical protein